MRVELIAHTADADRICAAAAQSCYSERPSREILDGLDPERASRTLGRVVGMGHHSVLEHATFTYSVEGVSRSLTHQLVRHRIASLSQQSQRYVRMDDADCIVPPSVDADEAASERFNELMGTIWDVYAELCETVPKEDARYVLPNACSTNITITMNARELLHFFSLRCCNRAQWEIRAMADEMLRLAKRVAPTVFEDAGPGCVRGKCPEGSMSCGSSRRDELKRFI